jgi:hypothetical protein
MRVKLRIGFPYGEALWWNKDHYERITSDNILRCLLDFTEVRAFNCVFNYKDHTFTVTADLSPLTEKQLVDNFRETFAKLFKKNQVMVTVLERHLSRKETEQVVTALMMEKLED